MNKHGHPVLSLWGHISNSYCFMKELNCIVYIESRESWAQLINFLWYFVALLYSPTTFHDNKILEFKWKCLKIIKAQNKCKLESTIFINKISFQFSNSNNIGYLLNFFIKIFNWENTAEVIWAGGCWWSSKTPYDSWHWLDVNSTPLPPFLISILFCFTQSMLLNFILLNFTWLLELVLFIWKATFCQ